VTDARFPDRWFDKRFQRLSDAHFRAYVTSLAWAVTNRTDGVVEPEDLQYIPNFAKDSVRAFLGAELWEPRGAAGRGWQIIDFFATQTTAAQLRHLEDKRAKEREKKARQRAGGKGDRNSPTRQGQARTGQEKVRYSRWRQAQSNLRGAVLVLTRIRNTSRPTFQGRQSK
jgi:hypothetical protein